MHRVADRFISKRQRAAQLRSAALTVTLLLSTSLSIHGCSKEEPTGNPVATAKKSAHALCTEVTSHTAPPQGARRSLQEQLRSAPHPLQTDKLVATGHAWVRLARYVRDEGLYQNAAACAELALKQDSRHDSALTLRGLAWMAEHRFAEVAALAQEVIDRDDEQQLAWTLLSDARLELGDIEGAVDAAQRLMDLRPALPAYSRAAHLRFVQGDSVGAKQLYAKAIRIAQFGSDKEALAWVLCEAASVFLKEDDHAGADAGYDQALASLPDYAPALLGKGRVALLAAEFDRAERLLTRAHDQSPTHESEALLAQARARRPHASE